MNNEDTYLSLGIYDIHPPRVGLKKHGVAVVPKVAEDTHTHNRSSPLRDSRMKRIIYRSIYHFRHRHHLSAVFVLMGNRALTIGKRCGNLCSLRRYIFFFTPAPGRRQPSAVTMTKTTISSIIFFFPDSVSRAALSWASAGRVHQHDVRCMCTCMSNAHKFNRLTVATPVVF